MFKLQTLHCTIPILFASLHPRPHHCCVGNLSHVWALKEAGEKKSSRASSVCLTDVFAMWHWTSCLKMLYIISVSFTRKSRERERDGEKLESFDLKPFRNAQAIFESSREIWTKWNEGRDAENRSLIWFHWRSRSTLIPVTVDMTNIISRWCIDSKHKFLIAYH